MSDKLINLVGICKSYDETEILKDFNLYIRKNEFLTLLGPSGCGKTTTLRIIAGFEESQAGQIFFEGKDITDLPPNKRNLNTVFQRYALFPHMNVADNIGFGLKLKGLSKKDIKKKTQDILKLVNLSGYENRSIDQLSGGQQQRIAIARALVNEPSVLLLDEPLGALDLKMRQEMQVELKRMQQQLGITFIYVTHDQEEALTMSDTIVVMKEGVIQQIGTPEDIYNEPKNAFVADFIGESNILAGYMPKDCQADFLGCLWDCVDTGFGPMEPVDVVIRPEDVEIHAPGAGTIDGTVIGVTFKGVHYEMTVETDFYKWKIHSTRSATIGETVALSVLPSNIHIMKKAVD